MESGAGIFLFSREDDGIVVFGRSQNDEDIADVEEKGEQAEVIRAVKAGKNRIDEQTNYLRNDACGQEFAHIAEKIITEEIGQFAHKKDDDTKRIIEGAKLHKKNDRRKFWKLFSQKEPVYCFRLTKNTLKGVLPL